MSAFLVSDGTMDRVVSAISKMRGRTSQAGAPVFAGVVLQGERAEDEIAQKLYSMNAQALSARYGDDEKELSLAFFRSYRWQPRGYNKPVEWFKALQCLLYQCSEGDVPQSALFKELDRLCRELADEIISTLPAYRAAPWDADRHDPRHAA